MESRVAVLQQVGRTTAATLDRIGRRQDTLAAELRAELCTDFRWLPGIMFLGFTMMLVMPGVTAPRFHWL